MNTDKFMLKVYAVITIAVIITAIIVERVVAQDIENPVSMALIDTTGDGVVDANLPVLRRAGWQVGYEASKEVLTIDDPQELSLGTLTTLPEGLTINIDGNRLMAKWKPTEAQAGTHNVVLQVFNATAPPFLNWTGPLITSVQTVVVQIHVFSEAHVPFLHGGPDILVSSSQWMR